MASGDETSIFHLKKSENVSGSPSSSTFVNKLEESFLARLPAPARTKIWRCLTSAELLVVAEACSVLNDEIDDFVRVRTNSNNNDAQRQEEDDLYWFIPFNRLFWMCQFHKYLDTSTIKNLRLVCRRMYHLVDVGNRISNVRQSSRNASLESISQSEIAPSSTTIFDLYIQDLKRICSFLPDSDLKSFENVCVSFSRVVKELRQYPFQEYGENTSEINLMDLPSEIHEKIFSFCPCYVRSNLRLVSKLMQVQVDTLAGVSVILNDRKWTWIDKQRLGRIPPASSLIVMNVEKLQSISHFVSYSNSRLLTSLILDGPFLPKAFLLILKRCINLKYIGLTYALQMGSIEDELRKSTPDPIELNSLRALNLKLQEKDLSENNVFRRNDWSWINAFELMKPSVLLTPNIISFYLCEHSVITHNLLYEVADKILKFFVDHRETIKHIEVILSGNCFRSCICPVYQPNIPEDVLKELKVQKYSCDCDWRICRPFNFILNCQTSLEELSFFKLSDWEFYAGIIDQNRCTLKSITIEKNLVPVIDFTAFADCVNLEHLWISRCGSANVTKSHPLDHIYSRLRFDPCLKNWDVLPTSIKSLHILDLHVKPSEIINIPRRLTNLEVLELQFIGKWDGSSFGLTEEAIWEILQLKKLNVFFLEDIRPIKWQGDGTLGKLLAEINLISDGFLPLSFDSMIAAVLIAERLPSSYFMPEWRKRVESYLAPDKDTMFVRIGALPTSLPRLSHANAEFQEMMDLLDDEEEEEEEEEDDGEESEIYEMELDDESILQINPNFLGNNNELNNNE